MPSTAVMQRKLTGKALALHTDYEAFKRKFAAAPRKLGPWRALDLATEYAQLQSRRLEDRIDALAAEVAELREPKVEPVASPRHGTPALPEGVRLDLELRGQVTRDKCDVLISKIKAAPAQDEIVLRLTTNGGDHEASVDLCDALLERKGRVRTIAEGAVLSAGTTIFMAGDRDARLCTADASFLIHKGNWETVPSAWRTTFNEGVESAQSDQLAKLFSRRTGKSWFAFRKMMRTDEGESMDAARAHELGIVSDFLPTRTRRNVKNKRKKVRKQ